MGIAPAGDGGVSVHLRADGDIPSRSDQTGFDRRDGLVLCLERAEVFDFGAGARGAGVVESPAHHAATLMAAAAPVANWSIWSAAFWARLAASKMKRLSERRADSHESR